MMNKYKRIILLCCTVLMGGLFINSSSGPGPGYTPAPFDSQTCGSCHGGGSFGTGVNLQLLSGSTVVSSYLPGQSYTVRINVSGSSPALGFQITSAFLGSNNNINNWGTLPPNTHNVNAGGHNYIEHTSPLTTSTIDIPWTAPSSTTNVMFYTSVNRVNLNGGSGGDQVATGTMNIPSGCATITVGPGSLPGGTVGSAYNQTITQSGATGSPTYTVSSGSLPAGLTLNPTTGAITGTPTTTGTSNFTITVTGGNGCTGSQSYSVTITCPTVTVSPATIPTMVVGTAVNQTYTQTGASGTVTWSATGLPPGVTLNTTTGVLSGTPTTTGTYNVVITASGNGPCSGSQSFTGTVVTCPTITISPATIPTMVVGTAISQTYTQTGASGTVTWSATGLPPGVSINSTTGLLSGTPTTTGTYNIVITATGNGPCSGSRSFSGTIVSCPTITVSPGTLGTMTVGSVFGPQTFTQSGGFGTINWSATGLPPGISINSTTGALSGTPTTAGNYTFTITATGNGPCSGSQTFTNFTVGCPTITVSPGTLPTIIVGSNYNQAFTQSGGTGTFTWSSTGTLPPGLTLSTGGVLSGTPTTNGTYTFTITATNTSQNCSGSVTITVTVGCAPFVITPGTLPNVAAGATYNQTIGQTGNFGTFSYNVTTGSLPPGLSLNSTTGQITGTANTAGTYTFTVTVTNQYGCSGTQTYTINVTCPTISLSPGTVPNAPIGQSYSQTLTVTGSSNTFTYAVTGGTLPTGITLSSGGVLSGTPTAAGTYTFTVTATDQFGCAASQSYTIIVGCPTISLSPGTLPPGNVGFTYSQTITVTGSTNTFTFSSSGSLPPGVTLNTTTGVISGTPTTAGTYTFTITATDQYGCTTNTTYNVVISPCTPLVLSPGTLPNGTLNTAYNQTITQTGGTGTITWSSTGTLPPGVTLDPNTGVLSGTPTTTGTYTFTIVATDANICTGTQQYTIDINCPNITLTPGSLPVDSAGQSYNETISQTGSTGSTFTYTVSNGSLPPGITLDANTGVLSGTGTATGTYTFDITVTDEFGCSATNTYTIEVVCPVITIDQSTLPTIFTNTAYNETLTTTGGTSPFTYAVTSGSLPGGITLDPGGLLSGTTTAYGNYTITVTVTDANGCTGMQTFNITVDWPVSVKSLNANEETVVLLPNLVSTRTTAQIISNYSGKAIISIIDMAGRTVLQQNISLSAGENKVDLDLREIAAGTYTLHVQPIKVKPVKFLKQ